MPFSLTFEIREGYVLGITTGEEATLDDSLRKIEAVRQRGLEVGLRRFLMDERQLAFLLEAHDIALLANRLEERNFQNNGNRVACLYNPECMQNCKMRETMYQNRSMNYRIFGDEESAVAWLLR